MTKTERTIDDLTIQRARGGWRAFWNHESWAGVYFHSLKVGNFPTLESAKAEFENQIKLARAMREKLNTI